MKNEKRELIYKEDARRASLKADPYVIFCIDNIKPVDAVEVVHAHWEDGCAIHNGKEVYKSIDCSHCDEVFKIESETREYWKDRFKVCPFCGAKMDLPQITEQTKDALVKMGEKAHGDGNGYKR